MIKQKKAVLFTATSVLFFGMAVSSTSVFAKSINESQPAPTEVGKWVKSGKNCWKTISPTGGLKKVCPKDGRKPADIQTEEDK